MAPLRYSINLSLDGYCGHESMGADEETHRYAVEMLARADALLFGRVTYEMMESAWRLSTQDGTMPEWTKPFAETIDVAKKYVVSSTLNDVDWNAELLRGDLREAVEQIKSESVKGIYVGGVQLPMALTEMGLIDEYEFLVHPRIVGHGPSLFTGLSKYVDLELTGRQELKSGAVALSYLPKK